MSGIGKRNINIHTKAIQQFSATISQSRTPMSRAGRANAAHGPQGITSVATYGRVSQGLEAWPLLQGLTGSGSGAPDLLAGILSVEDADGQGIAPNDSAAVAHSQVPYTGNGSPAETPVPAAAQGACSVRVSRGSRAKAFW